MFHTPAWVTQGWHSRLMGSQGLASDSGSRPSPWGSGLESPPLSAGIPSALGSLGTVLNLLSMWAGNHDPIAPLWPAASFLSFWGRLARVWTMEHSRGPCGAWYENAAQCTRQTMLITFIPLKATFLEFLPGWGFVSVDFQCVSSGPVEAQPQCSVDSQ